MNNDMLAKLLANENITVKYGNFPTAWFSTDDRILGMPNAHNDDPIMEDLFVVHEIGHALETPPLKDIDFDVYPMTLLNIFEDARIERKVEVKYPGSIATFSKGYKRLLEVDFFGELDIPTMAFLDKCNIKSKCREHVNIKFMSEVEQHFYNRSMITDTFEDVLQLVVDVAAYLKTLPKPETPDDTEPAQSNDADMTGNLPLPPSDQSNDKEDGESENNGEPNNEEDGESENNSQSNDEADSSGSEPDADSFESKTSAEYEENRQKMHDTNNALRDGKVVSSGLDVSKLMNDYNVLKTARDNGGNDFKFQADFDAYLKTIRKNIKPAVKEFEMHKSAINYQRALVSDTGVIDVNKLHSYKVSDDIFKRITNVANAKSHGVVLALDLSGSMYETLGHVVDQMFHLIEFCKKTNIKFEAYSFTTTGIWSDRSLHANDEDPYFQCPIQGEDTAIVEVINSSLKKGDYYEAAYDLWLYKFKYSGRFASPEYNGIMPTEISYFINGEIIRRHCKLDNLGGTPLNETLIAMHTVVRKFKSKHNIENMNFVLISDGEGRALKFGDVPLCNSIGEMNGNYFWNNQVTTLEFNIDGKKFTFTPSDYIKKEESNFNKSVGRSYDLLTRSLLSNLQTQCGCTTIGFYIADNAEFYRHCYNTENDGTRIDWGPDYRDGLHAAKPSYRKEEKKNNCVEMTNKIGFNKYYILNTGTKRNNNLAIQDCDVENMDDGMTHIQLKKSFYKLSKNKRNNKVLMGKIGKSIASAL